ncbi:MAG: YggS family pyridoxal phosphate-dependent enzyme [Ruminiclostridium sp.]|nr:YggS family pyridoxal phosphate-dependent enzyme [Ruminiclostridium sp.]MBQ8842799.1 YggS family pyridoxal phosphate-dependent enzyme [Ruminiclostridium sp.]
MTEKLSAERLSFVADNYRRLSERIENARIKAGRTDTVNFMAVTKTVPAEIVNHSVSLGIKLLGENRVQEFLDKYDKYEGDYDVHFIGGLQSNKVKYIIDKVSMIHSVDSMKLASEINKRALAVGKKMDILLEINIGGEESKNGIEPGMLDEFALEAGELPGLRIRGLMTIPPVDMNGSSERYFEKMERLYNDLKDKTKSNESFLLDTLSMGMSGDFEKAINYGSTIVRIGSLLFGYRQY